MTDIKFEIDLDNFTWGDLEDIESQSPTKIRQVMERCAVIDGVPREEMGAYLRGLPLRQMKDVSAEFMKAITALSNPAAANGKN